MLTCGFLYIFVLFATYTFHKTCLTRSFHMPFKRFNMFFVWRKGVSLHSPKSIYNCKRLMVRVISKVWSELLLPINFLAQKARHRGSVREDVTDVGKRCNQGSLKINLIFTTVLFLDCFPLSKPASGTAGTENIQYFKEPLIAHTSLSIKRTLHAAQINCTKMCSLLETARNNPDTP